MAQVYINLTKVRKLLSDQYAISLDLNNLSEQVEHIGNNLHLNISQKQTIVNNLRQLVEQIKEESNNVKDCANKLEQIVALYEQTEKEIAGNNVVSEVGDVIKNLSQDYDYTTTTFDDNDKNGTYGADQGDMAYHKKGIGFFGFRWFEDEDLFAFIRSYDRYKNYSQTEIAKLMDQINEEGCGYVAVVNNIFAEYEGREEEFEKQFGFPMYDKNGKPNYDYLIVDFYASTDDMYYLNDSMGATALANDVILKYLDDGNEAGFREKYGCNPLTKEGRISSKAKQKILDEYLGMDVADFSTDGTTMYSIENRFRHYLDEKGISYECETKTDLSTDQVNDYIDDGKNVNIASGEFNLYDENGKVVVRDVGDHWMTITGVTDDGRYIVSSWGERYYLEPSELSRQDFFITDAIES